MESAKQLVEYNPALQPVLVECLAGHLRGEGHPDCHLCAAQASLDRLSIPLRILAGVYSEPYGLLAVECTSARCAAYASGKPKPSARTVFLAPFQQLLGKWPGVDLPICHDLHWDHRGNRAASLLAVRVLTLAINKVILTSRDRYAALHPLFPNGLVTFTSAGIPGKGNIAYERHIINPVTGRAGLVVTLKCAGSRGPTNSTTTEIQVDRSAYMTSTPKTPENPNPEPVYCTDRFVRHVIRQFSNAGFLPAEQAEHLAKYTRLTMKRHTKDQNVWGLNDVIPTGW